MVLGVLAAFLTAPLTRRESEAMKSLFLTFISFGGKSANLGNRRKIRQAKRAARNRPTPSIS
jgi:hypothetical protein